jgi:deoxyribonucleoside regulator
MPETPAGTDDTIATAVWLYYEADLTQQQIADRLNVSRPTVVRMLQKARDIGLVEIRLTRALPDSVATGLRLERHLAEASVTRVIVGDADGKQAAANAAGRYLSATLTDDDVVGVGWSTTLSMISNLGVPDKLPQRLVQLVGSIGPTSRTDGYEIAVRIARQWGVPVSTIPAPVFAADAHTAQSLRSDPVVAETLSWFERCTVAVVGIGTVSPESTMVDIGYLSISDLSLVENQGGVADMLARYIDKDGIPLVTPWDDRVMGASVDQLRRTPNVIAVAAGPGKKQAVVGALRSGVINTLVVDASLAAELEGAW